MKLVKYSKTLDFIHDNTKLIRFVLILLIIIFLVSDSDDLMFHIPINVTEIETDKDTITAKPTIAESNVDNTPTIIQQPKQSTNLELIDKPYIDFLWGGVKTDKSLDIKTIKEYARTHKELLYKESNVKGKSKIDYNVLMAMFIYHSECGNSIVVTRYSNYFDVRTLDKKAYIKYDAKWLSLRDFTNKLRDEYQTNAKPTVDDWIYFACDVLLYENDIDRKEYNKRIKIIMDKIL